jgi:hypothetical protein
MRPLLLVHGLSGSAWETFGAPNKIFKKPSAGSMVLFLSGNGYHPGQDLFWYTYNSLRPIPFSARRLKDEIAKVHQITGCLEIDLVTFSLGGIVSKYYCISPLYTGEIHRMIMIAPPFLGSPWLNWLHTRFIPNESDMLFPGDGRALSPQILSFNNPFLLGLAKIPFPDTVDTTVIAARAVSTTRRDPLSSYARWLTSWFGEGDTAVPIKSTRVQVRHYFEVSEEFSYRMTHRFVPFHPKVKQLVLDQLLGNGELTDG